MLTSTRADILVAEVELDLLERALDEERRVAVDDRPQALLRQPGGDADHQLLADADVDHALWVPLDRPRSLEAVDADVGQDDAPVAGRSSSASEVTRVKPLAHALHAHALHDRDDGVRPPG